VLGIRLGECRDLPSPRANSTFGKRRNEGQNRCKWKKKGERRAGEEQLERTDEIIELSAHASAPIPIPTAPPRSLTLSLSLSRQRYRCSLPANTAVSPLLFIGWHHTHASAAACIMWRVQYCNYRGAARASLSLSLCAATPPPRSLRSLPAQSAPHATA
jgi:hypothetical protein